MLNLACDSCCTAPGSCAVRLKSSAVSLGLSVHLHGQKKFIGSGSGVYSGGQSLYRRLGFQSWGSLLHSGHKMPDDDSWPPKPDLPDPLTEYDKVIEAKIAALPQARQSRLLLIKVLREETGIDLHQAYACVNSYCTRHGLFAQTKTFRIVAWLGCLPSLSVLCFAGYLLYWIKRRDDILSLPYHHAVRLALDKELMAVSLVALLIALVSLGIQVIRLQ